MGVFAEGRIEGIEVNLRWGLSRIVGANENGQGRTSNAPIPHILFIDRLTLHGSKILFGGLVESGFGPVIEVNLTRSPTSTNLFIFRPTHHGPPLALRMSELHDDFTSLNIPNFEVGHLGLRR